MQRANVVSVVAGVVLAAAGLGALGGLQATDIEQARKTEDWMEEQRDRLQPPDAKTIHQAGVSSEIRHVGD